MSCICPRCGKGPLLDAYHKGLIFSTMRVKVWGWKFCYKCHRFVKISSDEDYNEIHSSASTVNKEEKP